MKIRTGQLVRGQSRALRESVLVSWPPSARMHILDFFSAGSDACPSEESEALRKSTTRTHYTNSAALHEQTVRPWPRRSICFFRANGVLGVSAGAKGHDQTSLPLDDKGVTAVLAERSVKSVDGP